MTASGTVWPGDLYVLSINLILQLLASDSASTHWSKIPLKMLIMLCWDPQAFAIFGEKEICEV